MLAILPVGTSGVAAFAKKPDTPADNYRASPSRFAIPLRRTYSPLRRFFGSQSEPKKAKYTHTWATAVKVVDRGPGQPPASRCDHQLDARHLGYQSAHVSRSSAATDFDLCTRSDEMLKNDERISLWGPYECGSASTEVPPAERIHGYGQVGYQCVDTPVSGPEEATAATASTRSPTWTSNSIAADTRCWRFGERRASTRRNRSSP